MAEIHFFPEEEEAFDPTDLRPLATVNRRIIRPLAGIEPAWVGKTGIDLCSTPVLIQLIQAQAAALGLTDTPPADLPLRLGELMDSPDDRRRALAREIAALHGQHLGALLASLLLEPSSITTPTIPWETAYLQHWRDTRAILLGGGRANGRLGQEIFAAMRGMLDQCNLGQRRLELAAHPSYLPLIGAACSIPAGDWQAAAVADFGNTRAKRGLAWYDDDGALIRLQVLPMISIEALTAPGQTEPLAAAIADSIAATLQQAGPGTALAQQVVCSVAAYVEKGLPSMFSGRNRGPYSLLRLLDPDLAGWFSRRIAEICGQQIDVQFAHDGDAAARALSGQPHTAVLLLGTYLGIGFAPPAGYCRRVSPQFTIQPQS